MQFIQDKLKGKSANQQFVKTGQQRVVLLKSQQETIQKLVLLPAQNVSVSKTAMTQQLAQQTQVLPNINLSTFKPSSSMRGSTFSTTSMPVSPLIATQSSAKQITATHTSNSPMTTTQVSAKPLTPIQTAKQTSNKPMTTTQTSSKILTTNPVQPMTVLARTSVSTTPKSASTITTVSAESTPTPTIPAASMSNTTLTAIENQQYFVISRNDLKDIINECIENHPRNRAVDQKLNKLVYMAEYRCTVENETNAYFPMETQDNLVHIENLLTKDTKQRAKIIKQIKRWKGTTNTKKTMNEVTKKVFTDKFLANYNLNGWKKQNKLGHYEIIKVLMNIFGDDGMDLETFHDNFQYCVRLAHNRHYRLHAPSNSLKKKKKDLAANIQEMENMDFIDEKSEDEPESSILEICATAYE